MPNDECSAEHRFLTLATAVDVLQDMAGQMIRDLVCYGVDGTVVGVIGWQPAANAWHITHYSDGMGLGHGRPDHKAAN